MRCAILATMLAAVMGHSAMGQAALPDVARGIAVPADKGYAVEQIGEGLYFVTDGFYTTMFMTTLLDGMRSDRVDRPFVSVQRLGFGGALEIFFFSCRHRVRGYRFPTRGARSDAPRPHRKGTVGPRGGWRCLMMER